MDDLTALHTFDRPAEGALCASLVEAATALRHAVINASTNEGRIELAAAALQNPSMPDAVKLKESWLLAAEGLERMRTMVHRAKGQGHAP